MTLIASKYSPKDVESKWYTFWNDNGLFESVPDSRPPYTIVIPPPNVTGVLHMGHMLNNTIQDVLVRQARMSGKNACWVPGTDHASIATEAKVVHLLKEKGIEKKSLSRDEFLRYAFEWKDKYGGIILEQLKKLGASCDWKRTTFTMDEAYYRDVIKVFCDLYDQGYIYRGVRMVNWDPQAQTAVSDEEVLHKESQGNLYYLKYKLQDSEEYIVIATTRPETIMGDVAIAVHPEDERYTQWHGKKVIVPLIQRAIPIITDAALDMSFGTGCLKVTPAHDIVDYEIGLRHNLEVIDIFNPDGTISEAGQIYIGEDRFVVRKKIVKQLEEGTHLLKTEPYTNSIGYSERTNAVIEPRLSLQWFLKMQSLSKPAMDAVMDGEVKLIPPKFINTYKHWMENVRDWCLSRQLWWGQRIPAYYIANTQQYVVAPTAAEALEKAIHLTGNKNLSLSDLVQDEDVLDTWASSWLWPISVFDGISNPDNPDFTYYYPTTDLVTAPEILFFWVARMIIAGKKYTDAAPFSNVYLTGIVRDKQGRKMSKSLGNSPDPLDLIEKYSADGVRMGMLLCSPAGNDLLFDEKYCEQGRNFCNKLWNAFRLVKSWELSDSGTYHKPLQAWFEAKLAKTTYDVRQLMAEFRLSEALMTLYNFVWDDFCSWYLEWIKPRDGKIDKDTYQKTLNYFEEILALLHPYMPFITEEIYHLMTTRSDGDILMIRQNRTVSSWDLSAMEEGETIQTLMTAIRNSRAQAQVSPKIPATIYINSDQDHLYTAYKHLLEEKSNLKAIIFETPDQNFPSFLINKDKIFIDLGVEMNDADEKKKIEEELQYYRGFVDSVKKKLDNEKFVANAKPEIVEKERQKLADGYAKISILEETLQNYSQG